MTRKAVATNSGRGVQVTVTDPRLAAVPPASVILTADEGFQFADEILTALDAGGQAHEMIIALGDCSFSARCRCGDTFGMIRPNQSFDEFSGPWERHVMAIA